ncbi:t-SNARE, partial [Coprinopsis marcescibilis]
LLGCIKIDSIKDSIRAFNNNVSSIAELHARAIDSINGTDVQKANNALYELSSETSALSETLKSGGSKPRGTGCLRSEWSNLEDTRLVKLHFMEAIQSYQSMELQYRAKHKQRLDRQIKIVKPDATPDEIQANATRNNSFGQLTNSRFTEASSAYKEVQERHDIKRIEKTLGELAQLFNDMSISVEQQEEIIDTIERQTDAVENDTKIGQLDDGVRYAAAARKKRWIFFITIVVVILAIIGAVVGAVLSNRK